jgi:hypothetical protein
VHYIIPGLGKTRGAFARFKARPICLMEDEIEVDYGDEAQDDVISLRGDDEEELPASAVIAALEAPTQVAAPLNAPVQTGPALQAAPAVQAASTPQPQHALPPKPPASILPPKPDFAAPALPPPWVQRSSKSNPNALYYYNTDTQETTWDKPGSLPAKKSSLDSYKPRSEGRAPRTEDAPSRPDERPPSTSRYNRRCWWILARAIRLCGPSGPEPASVPSRPPRRCELRSNVLSVPRLTRALASPLPLRRPSPESAPRRRSRSPLPVPPRRRSKSPLPRRKDDRYRESSAAVQIVRLNGIPQHHHLPPIDAQDEVCKSGSCTPTA